MGQGGWESAGQSLTTGLSVLHCGPADLPEDPVVSLPHTPEATSFLFAHGLPCPQPSSDEIPSLAINMIPLPSLENATGAPELKSPLSFFSGTFSTEVLRAGF